MDMIILPTDYFACSLFHAIIGNVADKEEAQETIRFLRDVLNIYPAVQYLEPAQQSLVVGGYSIHPINKTWIRTSCQEVLHRRVLTLKIEEMLITDIC